MKLGKLVVLLLLAVAVGGCTLFPWRSSREKYTERLVNERTRQGAWVGLISHEAAQFTADQIRRAREGTFRPLKVHVVKRVRNPLYVVEAEGLDLAPRDPQTQPPRLLGSAEGVTELSGPHLMMWNKKDTYVRQYDLRDFHGMLVDVTGDRIEELVLWSRFAELGEAPAHSKIVVVDLTRNLTQPRRGPRMFALVVEHGKLKKGEQMVWHPMGMGQPGIGLFRMTGHSPGGAGTTLEAKFPWDKHQKRFGGPLGGGVLAWTRRD